MYIVVTGDTKDGFVFYGPFADTKEAAEWAYNKLPILIHKWIQVVESTMKKGKT